MARCICETWVPYLYYSRTGWMKRACTTRTSSIRSMLSQNGHYCTNNIHYSKTCPPLPCILLYNKIRRPSLYLSYTQSVTIITFLRYLFPRQYNTFRHTHYIDRSLSLLSLFLFLCYWKNATAKIQCGRCPIIGDGTVEAWHPAIV